MRTITKTMFCSVFLLTCTSYAAGNNIKGLVHDHNNEPLAYFTVSLLNPSDSSIISGGVFVDGYFEFTDLKQEKYLLKISSLGFQTVFQPVGFGQDETIDLGTIQLKTLELDEVVIRAQRPVFRQEAGKLIVNVKGTSLSEAGDLFDALKRSPGLIVDNNNNISIPGKGTPIIFINNREVQNKAELESLQSGDISTIVIDRNPSAEYSASGKAVVRIRTVKITREQFNLELFNRSYVARKYRNVSGIRLNNRMGKTSGFLSYNYANQDSKNYEDSYEINQQDNYTIDNRTHTVRDAKEDNHNLFASVDRKISDRSTVGFQYSYVSKDKNRTIDADQRINKTGEEETKRKIFKDIEENNDLQTFNLNYELNIDSVRSLTVIGDYSRVEYRSTEAIDEQSIKTGSHLRTFIDNTNDYDIYSGKADYKTPLFSSIFLQSGVQLSKVKNEGTAISTDQDLKLENFRTADQIDDRIAAAYFNLDHRYGSLNLKCGLRCEYTKTEIVSDGQQVVDSTYGNWFPSFSVNRKFSDHLDFTLSYSKKINRPGFDELSTDITYFDSLSYSVGNPAVRPAISHNVDLTLGLFHSLSLNLGYRYEKNSRVLSVVNDEKNPNIIKYTPVNISKAEWLFANLDYHYSGKKFNSSIGLGGEKPFVEIPYLGDDRKVRAFSWYFQTSNDFAVTGKTKVLARFSYHSSKEDLMTHFGRWYNFSLGVNTSFLKKKLEVSLLANDLLNSSDGRWEDKYGRIIAGLDPDYDNTWLRLSVKFNFNHFKGSLVRKKSASDNELNRL